MIENLFDILKQSKADAFPYSVKSHVSHRVRAGTYLAGLGLRKNKDYWRETATGLLGGWMDETRIDPDHIDTFWFKCLTHATMFRLWVPDEIDQNGFAEFKKTRRARIDISAVYHPYILLTITGNGAILPTMNGQI